MAASSAIGLDIGTSVVRAAEVSFGRSGVQLERFGQMVLPEGSVRDGEVVDSDAIAETLKNMWRGAAFTHKNVMIGVGNQRVLARPMTIPWMSEADMVKGLAFQVADVLPMPAESAVLDFCTLEETTDELGSKVRRGMLVAAAKSMVSNSIECAEKAGLKVVGVDLTSFALLRAVGRHSGLDVETEALIEIGAQSTNIIIHSAGEPRFVRILLLGGQDITDAISEALGVTNDEAETMKQRVNLYSNGDALDGLQRAVSVKTQEFVDEIRGSLNFFANSNPNVAVERVLLSGGSSQMVGLREHLANSLNLPVESGDPFSMMSIGNTGLDGNQLDQIRPLAAVPVGLALGAIR